MIYGQPLYVNPATLPNCSKLSYWRGLYLCTIRGIKGVPGYLAAVVSLTLRSLIKALTFTSDKTI